MPSVLTELGFISNHDEGVYLNSEEGQNKISQAIAQAILNYKKGYMGSATLFDEKVKDKPITNHPSKETGDSSKQKEKSKEKSKSKKESSDIDSVKEKEVVQTLQEGNKVVVYKIQIAAGTSKIKTKPSNFKGLDSISVTETTGKFKYFYGETSDYEQAKKMLNKAKEAGYQSSFIVSFN